MDVRNTDGLRANAGALAPVDAAEMSGYYAWTARSVIGAFGEVQEHRGSALGSQNVHVTHPLAKV